MTESQKALFLKKGKGAFDSIHEYGSTGKRLI
jgi:hypothetical protein